MKILTQGFGADMGLIAVYIERPPPMSEYHNLNKIQALIGGEINAINMASGNGWRKVFNVYAKFIAQLNHRDHNFTKYDTWQKYRDNCLLQQHSQEALLFSPPKIGEKLYKYHIIAGRTYAKKLLRDQIFTNTLEWLDDEFAVDRTLNLVVCPYFDYRQLSNIKIGKLCGILHSLD
ncbi:hypothetical protein CWB96_20375 [Pseudoalteromonas citrea]|uniref:Uncharacterized protein n=1 Tax=Pseudoalteromonas citrea TaxID=43655 RepID=A0A5S3XJU7_9GAMM|nr:hypothetical protein [Pseudoalteromonas citrea]TMP41173.1 hypothetical protein CWB97_15445 [Pseudoalteromonas citrea]TMP53871.1 hypothetical protein CWB96_20375 [Pseudoalteromonas citrea]